MTDAMQFLSQCFEGTLLTQKVLKGSVPYSDIGKGSTYIPGMIVEPFSITLYGKEPQEPFGWPQWLIHISWSL